MKARATKNQPNRICVTLNEQELDLLRKLAPEYCSASASAVVQRWLYERLREERQRVKDGDR